MQPSDIVSDIDSDLNPYIGVPDIVSDIDTDIRNVMPDVEVSNYDIGLIIRAPLISVLISEAWCSYIGVYPISESPISGHKTTISDMGRGR
jgi:hypothetical protein